MKFKMLLIGLCLFTFSQTSQAQTTKRKVVKTQVKQQKRIQHGVANGELTKREAIQLQKQQANIQRTKKRAAADGIVTRKEKSIIRTKQARANKNIARKKHNSRDRN